MENYLFKGQLIELDEAVAGLIEFEKERQKRKLIMIPSESFAPDAVLESLGSIFQNIYAEGYPDEGSRRFSEDEIMDYDKRLGEYRRLSDPRYYKGVEYVDILEALARRRCAEAFANERVSVDEIQVNVQPLSGAPANNAAYHLINPGDTVLAMDLLHGGHLTHGSPVNRTGMLYNIVQYTINPETEMIDYDAIQKLANECQPKMIIAGYTSYPYIPDWKRYREIADSVGAYLLADIAHIAGLIAGGAADSPVGYADVITFTTQKTMTGPRGACILTTDPKLAKIIDKAVFPGEQGGPHAQVFAAMATTFKFAKTDEFKSYSAQIMNNRRALVEQFEKRGLKVAYKGSDSHMALLDCKVIKGEDGTTLSGDIAARVLDLAGITLNRNTIPGDKSALRASGIRLGTPCITQIGLKETDMEEVGNIIADVLFAIHPYSTPGAKGMLQRAKVEFAVLEQAKIRVRALCEKCLDLNHDPKFGYPHFYYLDDKLAQKDGQSAIFIQGDTMREFVNFSFQSDAEALTEGRSQPSILWADGAEIRGELSLLPGKFQFVCPSDEAAKGAAWLRALSDGFVKFDPDLRKRMPGVNSVTTGLPVPVQAGNGVCFSKPYAPGLKAEPSAPLPEFRWQEPSDAPIRETPLHETHKALGAKMVPFAGWDMPVWYTSIKEEHAAVREAGGLFDVAHMGVYLASGPDALPFLDSVCANDITVLEIGDTCYTHLLDPDANVLDDLIIYRIEAEKYLVVVNASNDDKDWAWLNAAREGKVLVDRGRPGARAFGRNVLLENLRDPQAGSRMRVDLALQGKIATQTLLGLGCSEEDAEKIRTLKKGHICQATVGGFDVYLARTGYTGEKISFEIFIHPDQLVALWNALLKVGAPLGLKPCGLGARDSLRVEAGLPLYGHEMAGEMNLKVNEAGFANFVKTYKPWFIGQSAYRKDEAAQDKILVRFRFNEKAVRMAHYGDPVLDAKGSVIGTVTSCAMDRDGWIMGLAMVKTACAAEGTALWIYQNCEKVSLKEPGTLKIGAKTTLPGQAAIISRYPKL